MSTRLCAAQARQRHPTSGLRTVCTRLLVALVAIVGAPLAAAQACTQGNTIVDGVGGRIDVADYENDLSCSWTLTCSGGAPTLSFDTFDTEANFDFVYLYEGTDAGGALLESVSGVGHAPMSYNASGSNSLYLVFETDYSVTRAGFTATFTCETGSGQSECPETPYTLDNFGVINIQDYVDNLDCSWTLTCAVGVPTLSFDTFDTEANFDFIYVYEGDSPGGDALVDGLSGDGYAPMTYSTDASSSLYLRFTSDGSVTRAGFRATFTCPMGNFFRTSTCGTWDTTRAECQASGGDLAVITSAAKNTAVVT
jgi:hypothetical protein